MTEHVLQIFGATSLGLFGLLLFYIGAGHWYCRYGREALLCVSAYLILATAIIALSLFDVIDPLRSRTINLLLSTCFLFIMIEIVVVHYVFHRYEDAQGGSK